MIGAKFGASIKFNIVHKCNMLRSDKGREIAPLRKVGREKKEL
jgi:ABC-type lipoprotein release transport system permease subunit